MRQIELIANALGTICKVALFVDDTLEETANRIINEIRDYLLDMDNRLSVFKSDSEISKINSHSGEVIVSPLTFSILKDSIMYYKKTGGVFDVLIGCSSKRYREGQNEETYSLNSNIEENLLLNKRKNSVFLKEGYQIDLGGIAKGFAVNHIKKTIKKANINKAIINLGGSVLVLGEKTKVGIRNPYIPMNKGNQDVSFAEVLVDEDVVITSGLYEQSKNEEMTIHHIIDPKTGMPSKTDLLSVSVIDKDGVKADVFATALIVLGLDEGIKLVKKNKINAVFVTRKGEIIATNRLKNLLFIK